EQRQIAIVVDRGDHMHARQVVDVVGQRRPGRKQDWGRGDGGQRNEQNGDLAGAEANRRLRHRLGIAGDAGASCRWRGWGRPLGCAQSEELTDINHFGLCARALLTKAMRKIERSVQTTPPGGACWTTEVSRRLGKVQQTGAGVGATDIANSSAAGPKKELMCS